MKIDVHSHIVLEETFGKAGRYGPWLEVSDNGVTNLIWSGRTLTIVNPRQREELAKYGTSSPPAWAISDPKARVAEMDEKGIDMIGVTISPLFYLYAGEPDIATPFALAQNDALARYCAAAPSRLFFMPTLPLQDMDASLEEVARAVTELGGKAINIGAHNVAGRELDDEYFYPLWGKCEELDIPVMLHPEPSGFIQGARALTAAEYLLDYCYQDTLAPLTMMVGGVFDHFPRLKVYCTHGGGFLPFQWRRFEIFTEDKIGSGRMGTIKMKKALRDYLPNLYLDLLIHDLPARQLAIDLVGADNVIVGDNFDGADSADGFQFVEELCLSKNDEAKIMGENAKQLLKL